MLFTTDSDAPDTSRVCYVGTDNVAAGRQAADFIKQALPDGGKIMVFVGWSVPGQTIRAQPMRQQLGKKVDILNPPEKPEPRLA